MQKCKRCGTTSASLSMSWLNEDMVCSSCKNKDHLDPAYNACKKLELNMIRREFSLESADVIESRAGDEYIIKYDGFTMRIRRNGHYFEFLERMLPNVEA